jgi:hypothetical protein
MHEARTRLNRSVVFAVNDGVSGLQAPDGLIRSAGEFTPLPLPRLGGSARDRSFFLNGCHRTSSIKRISIPLADRNTLVRRGYRRMRQRLGRSTPVTVGVAVRCPLFRVSFQPSRNPQHRPSKAPYQSSAVSTATSRRVDYSQPPYSA